MRVIIVGSLLAFSLGAWGCSDSCGQRKPSRAHAYNGHTTTGHSSTGPATTGPAGTGK